MQGNCLDFNIFLYSTKLIPLIIIIIISILTFNLVNHVMSFLSSLGIKSLVHLLVPQPGALSIVMAANIKYANSVVQVWVLTPFG